MLSKIISRFGRRLESLLEDETCVGSTFTLVRTPANSRDADYIVLHPQRGLLFLEIKDWKLPKPLQTL
jgi:hypothetical protein